MERWLRRRRNQTEIFIIVATSLLVGALVLINTFYDRPAEIISTTDTLTRPKIPMDKAIIGTWQVTGVLVDGSNMEKETTYAPNGTSHVVIKISGIKQDVIVHTNSSWYIKNGYIYETIKSSDNPRMAPAGFADASKIIEINDNEFSHINSFNNATIVEARINSPGLAKAPP